MRRRAFLRLAGGGAVLVAAPALHGCSSSMPSGAIEAWDGPATESNLRKWLLGYAILAPHSHNLQSWMVDLRQDDEITLYCDLGRLLPEADPHGRQTLISHGAFLELLVMAAKERGMRADVQLFPQGPFGDGGIDLRPVARVRLARDAKVVQDPLFAQALRRRTSREAYEARGIPREAMSEIDIAARAFPVRTGFVGSDRPDAIARLRAIAAEAWRIELTTPRTALETYRWLRVGPAEIEKHRDGIAINRPLVRLFSAVGLFDRSKAPAPDSYAVTSQIRDFRAKLDATPAFFSLVTEGNDRSAQVEAGRAWMRAQLAATLHGLSMQPLSQALQEYPEMAGPYSDIHEALDAPRPRYTVQMWSRIGFGPEVEPAPRRGLKEQIIRS